MATASLGAQIGWKGGWERQRASNRTLVVVSAKVEFDGKSHIGLIRDISRHGLFVYSDFTPNLGDSMKVILRESNDSLTGGVSCLGQVVRVESKGAGTATGIALKIIGYGI
ncbi:MAG TPA: PilZ domain-containing protein [Terriglobales bacterium]|nr:PilZ domain-containing protein [Terriglobales bacterium]